MASPGPILFISRNYPPAQGGIETMADELVRYGLRTGERLVLLHIGQKACEPAPQGLVAYAHVPSTGRLWAFILANFAVPFYAWRHKPSMIVNMQVTTGFGSLLASWLLGIPYVVLCMGMEVLPGNSALWRYSRAVCLRGANRVLSISRFTDGLMDAFGVKPENRKILHPGTRPFKDTPSPQGRAQVFGSGSENLFICLSLSRLVPRKGIDKVLEALAHVIKIRNDILYCVGGAGSDLPRLKTLVKKYSLEKHVRFLGQVPDGDKGPCYANADVFLMPCRSSESPPDVEGFGIVFLEAGACGTPSLGGASGGVPDAVLDGETGYLVDPEDSMALAEKILLLMSDRELLLRLGQNARLHAEACHWDSVCQRYFEAFNTVHPRTY